MYPLSGPKQVPAVDVSRLSASNSASLRRLTLFLSCLRAQGGTRRMDASRLSAKNDKTFLTSPSPQSDSNVVHTHEPILSSSPSPKFPHSTRTNITKNVSLSPREKSKNDAKRASPAPTSDHNCTLQSAFPHSAVSQHISKSSPKSAYPSPDFHVRNSAKDESASLSPPPELRTAMAHTSTLTSPVSVCLSTTPSPRHALVPATPPSFLQRNYSGFSSSPSSSPSPVSC